MPRGRTFDKKTSTTFQLCYKSYADPSYEDENTMGTLALRSKAGKFVQHDDLALFEWGLQPQMNMHETEDTVETMEANAIFKDGYWDEFDQDFIQQMMERAEDESTAVLDIDNYPTHDLRKATTDIDRAFDREMKDFDNDYDLDPEDTRVRGPLLIDDYEGAMDEFLNETRQVSFFHHLDPQHDEPVGFVRQGKRIEIPAEMQKQIFHADEKGVYLTVLQSKKQSNVMWEYLAQRTDAHKTTKQMMQVEEEPDLTLAEEEEIVNELCPPKQVPEWDAQTIVSTFSNLENHPELIQEVDIRKKFVLSNKSGLPKNVRIKEPTKTAAANGKADDDVSSGAESDDDDLQERLSIMTSTTSLGRPKDETPEERRQRKELCKMGKKMRREQKKLLKQAFKCETITQRMDLQYAETQRRNLHLSSSTL